MRITIAAWECEKYYHRWIAESDEPPKRCAKCKARKWHELAAQAPEPASDRIAHIYSFPMLTPAASCKHPPPASFRVGDNCINCNQKWR